MALVIKSYNWMDLTEIYLCQKKWLKARNLGISNGGKSFFFFCYCSVKCISNLATLIQNAIYCTPSYDQDWSWWGLSLNTFICRVEIIIGCQPVNCNLRRESVREFSVVVGQNRSVGAHRALVYQIFLKQGTLEVLHQKRKIHGSIYRAQKLALPNNPALACLQSNI